MTSSIPNGAEFRKFAVQHRRLAGTGVDAYMHQVNGMTRSVIEERTQNFREIDVFSRLMMDRIIFLGTDVDDYIANIITAQLLFLESNDPGKDITMYVNSPGGSVYAGLGIMDTMNYITPDVCTVCTGLAASMGAIILSSGEKPKRAALPHARIMIHQPSGGVRGQSSDIEITAREIQKLKKELYEILAERSGQPVKKVNKDSDRDYWMTAEEAREYGLIDEVLTRSKA